jgi:hypothetical protein
MKRINARLTALLLLCVTSASAWSADARLSTAGEQLPGTVPSAVPAEYLITPNGYFHASCVHRIAAGETVLEHGQVRRADGSLFQQAACAYPHFTRDGQRIEARSQAPVINNWVASSSTDTANPPPPAGALEARWTVPAAPTKKGTQVVYFFPGLEPSSDVRTILQPVLGWNAFSDRAWTLASWNCCVDGSTNHSDPVTVNVGDSIYGVIYGTCAAGTICDNWQIQSLDTTTGASTLLATSGYGQVFNWYFGGVLEAYGVRNCAQYPANGSIAFTDIVASDYNFEPLSLTWLKGITSVKPQCDYKVKAKTSDVTTILFSTQ